MEDCQYVKRCKFSRKRTEKEESDLELGAAPEKVKNKKNLPKNPKA